MALAESSPIRIGATAPDFTLPDARNNQPVSLSDYNDQAILIVFMCNHCPYVVHLLDALTKMAHAMANSGLASIAISANDIARYPQDGPMKMAELAQEKQFKFPYCFDEAQTVAKAYDATCTPDIFLFDTSHKLYYHGQFDDTRPGKGRAHGADLQAAINSLLADKPAPTQTLPSVGCSIKWKT